MLDFQCWTSTESSNNSSHIMLGNPVMDLHPIQVGVAILLPVASCCKNRFKLRPCGSLRFVKSNFPDLLKVVRLGLSLDRVHRWPTLLSTNISCIKVLDYWFLNQLFRFVFYFQYQARVAVFVYMNMWLR